MADINNYSPRTGRVLNEASAPVNIVNDLYGKKIDAATIPTGGVGLFGWLSAIWTALTAGISVIASGRSAAIAGKAIVVTAGTPVSLASAPCGAGVTFIANINNVGEIYVYPAAGAKTDVIPLRSGDSIFWPVSNISALKVDASVSGESVFWMGAV